MVGRGAAAAAGNVQEAGLGELAHQARGHVGRLVEAGIAHRVGQAGVGVAAHRHLARHLAQLLDVGPHQRGAQRAVQADGNRPGVAHRMPEGRDRLARQDAAGGVRHGARDDDRQALAGVVHQLVHREDGGLGIERVEDGFDQEDIRAAVQQALGLLVVGVAQGVEVDVTGAGVVDVRADGRGARRGAEGTRHVARFVRRRIPVAGDAGDLRGHKVHLVGQLGQVVVFLRNRGGAEGVGLDQVSAGGEVLLVDLADDIGPREQQQLVVALQVLGVVLEALAAVVGLGQLVALDHRAHRAVEHGDALLEQGRQALGAGVGDGLHGGAILAARAIASPSWAQEALPPRSGVLGAAGSASTASMAAMTASCAAWWPRKSSIIAPAQIWPMGLAMPLPAMSGAEPCTGSNRLGHSRVGFRLAEGATAMVPVQAGPRSDRMSPNRLLATTTSKACGRCTKCAQRMSMWNLSTDTPGNCAAMASTRSSQ
mmetsp:Transcript_36612/g.84976  ORF Transcript_36612/g.84976 Transcript_36612/m.84976 type:complete len:483 (-) Transcript_36612:1085-2533(-)